MDLFIYYEAFLQNLCEIGRFFTGRSVDLPLARRGKDIKRPRVLSPAAFAVMAFTHSSIGCACAALSISSASSVVVTRLPVAFSHWLSMACRVAASARPVSSRP